MTKKLSQLDLYLDQFNLILKELKNRGPVETNNVTLGGSLIFKVHGLNFSRNVDDLDIIITNPTEEQKQYFNLIKAFSILKGDYGYDYETTNFKFIKNGLTLNILVINDHIDENPYKTYYKYKSTYHEIVSINEIIKAKKRYDRLKDRNDFELLKKENF